MNNILFISLINNAALLLSLGLIYDILYRRKTETLPILNKIASGLIIGVIAVVLMATPARWESGIIFDTRTILLGLTGLFFGTLPTLLAMAIAGAYRLSLGGGGALMGIATIISSSLVGLSWRHYRLHELRGLSLPELYLFGGVVHFVMILCMFLLPQEAIQRTISTLALPVIVIYPVCTALLGNLLSGRLRRYRIEKELRDTTYRFNRIAEQSRTVTWEVDTAGLYTYVSPAAESVFGYRPEELIGKMHFYDIHPEEGREEFKEAAFAVFKRNAEFEDMVNPVQTKDGRIIWVSTNGLSIQTEDGSLKGYRGSDKDVTDRKQAEDALKESEKKYSRLIDTANEGVLVIDENRKTTFVNARLAQMLGYGAEEMIGQPLDSFLFPEDLADLAARMGKRRCGEGEVYEKRYKMKDGQALWTITSAASLMSETGQFQGVVSMITDITERKHAEKEQGRLQAQLLQAQKMESIGTLAGGIAHDFNNILSAIIGYGNLALMKMPKNDPQRLNIEHMIEAGDRAAHLTKDLLLFSRKQISERTPVDLNDIIRKVEKFLKRVIGEDVECKTQLFDEALPVLGDAHQLEQVLMNLATNARDAMTTAGGIFSLAAFRTPFDDKFLSVQGKPGKYALVMISDTGKGMDAATREHIFEPFFTTKEVGKGTGLGLSVVFGIIKQHDGFIDVYSEPDQGTTFKIYLPLISSSPKQEQQGEEEYPAGGTETILLAEDDAAVRAITRKVLEDFGYKVITAHDGQDAVDKYRENKDRIQLLLFDLIMPKKSGKGAYDEIRAIRPDIKILFQSGYAPDVVRQKVLLEEKMALVFKPVSPIMLLKQVRNVLDRAQ